MPPESLPLAELEVVPVDGNVNVHMITVDVHLGECTRDSYQRKQLPDGAHHGARAGRRVAARRGNHDVGDPPVMETCGEA